MRTDNLKNFYFIFSKNLQLAGIWHSPFWLEYFEYLLQGNNAKTVSLYELYTLYSLLQIDADIIPEEIVNEGKHTLLRLNKEKSLNFIEVDLASLFYKTYNTSAGGTVGMKSQTFLANSLRLVNKGKI